MRTSSTYSAFNARWISPEEVARTFVPIPQLNSLVKFQNSLLMGPRGCGKTTLLKMLTRSAQEVWRVERVSKEPSLQAFDTPEFEAIYVPSDVRWSYELRSLKSELSDDPVLAERVQRASIAITSVTEATNVFEMLLRQCGQRLTDVPIQFLHHFDLRNIVPTFSEIRLALLSFGETITNAKVRRDTDLLRSVLDELPAAFTGHALDTLGKACSVFEEYAPKEAIPNKWAFCFDELEIAPEWLQVELLNAFRSYHQRALLKLTWSPVLPVHLMSQEEQQHDYATIRMWHSHFSESRTFCRNFSTQIIRSRFGHDESPRSVFGPSLFTREERIGQDNDVYGRHSEVWEAMVRLAERDPSFALFLKNEDLDPQDPVSEDVTKRDECLRKVKPIVLLREAYFKGVNREHRSRKSSVLYAGEETIYAMSEGNPRLLAGLLNELLDTVITRKRSDYKSSPMMPREVQFKVLNAASSRMQSFIRAYPTQTGQKKKLHLAQMVERLGNYLFNQLVGGEFPGDPVGSFVVDSSIGPSLEDEIGRGLLIGAFVFVGKSPSDVPSSIVGARIRLTHMLAPKYRLLLRNYRWIRLSQALRIAEALSPQMEMYGGRREN